MPTNPFSGVLSHPTLYHYLRQVATGGMPFDRFIRVTGLSEPGTRLADLGCGPADILRFMPGVDVPEFYLGIDVSDRYLSAARARASAKGIRGQFLAMDLERLPVDERVQAHLLDTLQAYEINTVLIMGVLHHISDEAACETLNLMHRVPGVRRVVSQDVVRIPRHRINNLYCDFDRGEFVRNEEGYQALMRQSAWSGIRQEWTQTGIRFIKYINFVLSR